MTTFLPLNDHKMTKHSIEKMSISPKTSIFVQFTNFFKETLMPKPPLLHPILKLIEQGEHQQQDFKFAVNDAKKIARTLSAFANTDGGKLLIGVKDNGAVAGVRSDEEYHMIESAAQLYCKPEIAFSAKKHIVNSKIVLEIDIAASNRKPHLAPDENDLMRAYIRYKDENKVAQIVHFKAMTAAQKEHSVQIHFSEAEKFLLEYLETHPNITHKKYSKYAGISHQKATEILSDLLNLNLIRISYAENPPVFQLY